MLNNIYILMNILLVSPQKIEQLLTAPEVLPYLHSTLSDSHLDTWIDSLLPLEENLHCPWKS